VRAILKEVRAASELPLKPEAKESSSLRGERAEENLRTVFSALS